MPDGRSYGHIRAALPWLVAVAPSIRLGLELPPPPRSGCDGGPSRHWRDAFRELAEAAAEGGFDSVWINGNIAGRLVGDPPALAGGMCSSAPRLTVGVVAALASGRHPAVVAREVTTVDHLSSGRAAVLIEGSSLLAEPADRAEELVEAATVCRLLFTRDAPDFDGRYFRVAAAANRPPPVAKGGPLVLVDVGPVGVQSAASVAQVRAFDRAVAGERPAIDGVVVRTGPFQLAALQQELERSAARLPGGPVSLLWRGELPPGEEETAEAVGAVLSAGVDGMICRFPGERPPSAEAVHSTGTSIGRLRARAA